jgi:hypothetical protein
MSAGGPWTAPGKAPDANLVYFFFSLT